MRGKRVNTNVPVQGRGAGGADMKVVNMIHILCLNL